VQKFKGMDYANLEVIMKIKLSIIMKLEGTEQNSKQRRIENRKLNLIQPSSKY
jgi:hypothetical protein